MVTRGNVLVVDDEVNLCRILGAKLAKSGYSVVAVHDGLQAVEKVRESDFDIVLLDLILPKMDGLTALAEIRNLRNTLPVIVMTACENADAYEQARHYGVSAYVNKPFDLDNLVSLVTDTSLSTASVRSKNLPKSTVLFVKNQPITIEYQNGHGPKTFGSCIYDKDDRTLSVLAPVMGDKVVDIAPRTSVKVGLASRDAFYSFNTQVLKANRVPERVIVLDKPGVIYRIQRREYTRVLTRVPVHYSCDSQSSSELKLAQTRDISLGGASIVVHDDVHPGDVLRVELHPKTDSAVIGAVAHVLRSHPNDDFREGGTVLGCRFTSIDDSLRKLFKD